MSLTARKLRITVLRGGPSAEREVSLQSGAAIATALRRGGHEVHESDIGPDNLTALDHPADVVFPALHGTFGEDGTLQAIMEERHIRFVGSGAQASRLAMNKVDAKVAVAAAGIDTPAYEVLTAQNVADRAPRIAIPAIVKPVSEGSSVLTTIVREPRKLLPAIEPVIERYGEALVETLIVGDELTVGILGSQALPPICVRPKREFYDYTAKYAADDTEYLFDAGHPAALLRAVQSASLAAFKLLGCRHLGRVDWMVDRTGRLWFLEVNTLPGFTSHSLVPKAAAKIGVSFDELVDLLAHMALVDVQTA
jgi:D-alanine-D-alanine ligase